LFSIFGAILSIFADYFSGFSENVPIHSLFFDLETVARFGAAKTLAHLQLGHYLIILSFPMMYTAITHLFSGLSMSHMHKMRKLFLISFTLAFFWAFTFHFSITFISFLYIKVAQGSLALSAAETGFISNLFYFAAGVMSLSFFLVNASFFVMVFFSKTAFPKYVAVFNPLVISLLFSAASQVLPSPYAQFFYITAMNWGLFIWLSLSLVVFRNLPLSENFPKQQT